MIIVCRSEFRLSAVSAATAPRSKRLYSLSKRSRGRWEVDRAHSRGRESSLAIILAPRLRGDERPGVLLSRGLVQCLGIVIEDRRQPPLGVLESLVLAARIVFDLIALDLADAEIITFRMTEIEAA